MQVRVSSDGHRTARLDVSSDVSCSSQSGEASPPRVLRAPTVWPPGLEPQPDCRSMQHPSNSRRGPGTSWHCTHTQLARLGWAVPLPTIILPPAQVDQQGDYFIASTWFVLFQAQRCPPNRLLVHCVARGYVRRKPMSTCKPSASQPVSPPLHRCGTRIPSTLLLLP